jgi:hypothetical protein
MKVLGVAAVIALGIMSLPAHGQSGKSVLYMGEISCGSWPEAEAIGHPRKASALNLVLGLLFGRASQSDFDTLQSVDVASVAAWMDNYCEANPLDTIIRGAYVLEAELRARAGR